MLSIPSLVRVYVHVDPVNMHWGFERLAAIVREQMGYDPLSGHLFVFHNRRGDRIKLLFWDDDGYAVFYKLLQVGAFRLPSVAADQSCITMTASELSMLLWGIDSASVRRGKRFSLDKQHASIASS
ncbi:MAG: IS66 family insertion sequence element accessory protein TnpB [Pirellulaceae bacterium]|nr:IS66 family insertion sequence element accessory protein TnpB [Planctomycetales bacterium]MCA9265428.1 IS66 family insertion sequence element accessory protein TnpB [Planctomycetales bacterium]